METQHQRLVDCTLIEVEARETIENCEARRLHLVVHRPPLALSDLPHTDELQCFECRNHRLRAHGRPRATGRNGRRWPSARQRVVSWAAFQSPQESEAKPDGRDGVE